MSKISVILPVYNTEHYLPRCIDSVLSQTFTDFELLLIDDGSKDSSGQICDEYAAKDSRVRVFHKENGGVSSARNIGLDKAKGEWVAFVDSDDILNNGAFDIFQNDNDVDLIITSHIVNSGGIFSLHLISNERIIIEGDDKDAFIKEYINSNIIKTVWAKFFKNEILSDLRFDEKIICGEDFLFVLTYLQSLKRMCIEDYCSYVYTIPECHFHVKYQTSIEQSIYTLQRLFETYNRLNIKSYNFECSLFYDYKSLCQKEIYRTPNLWYKNEIVCQIYDEIKSHFGLLFRIKYKLMSCELISKILTYVRGYK